MGFPSGTVTFLFTDIEGSTRLWESVPELMREALESHDAIVRAAIERHGGHVFATGGDGFAAAFARAGEALHAAGEAQAWLAEVKWTPGAAIRVRIGVNTGEAVERAGDYFGPAVNRTARLMAIAHGGQVLCSAATAGVVDPARVGLVDLGSHRLRDLGSPQRVFQLGPGSFPPLRSLDTVPTNLPVVATELIGRETDVSGIEKLLGSERVVTLTGVGGVGKTRLALAVAGGVAHQFTDGCWLVELAPVAPGSDVVRPIAETLGIAATDVDGLARHLAEREALLVLDNCEHVLGSAAEVVATIVRAGRSGVILATSREPLGISGEVVRAVRPLAVPDREGSADELAAVAAVRLFVERAEAASADFPLSDETISDVSAICRRLDGIPLALELAAARTRSMPTSEIARRLDERFRLITGGRGGADRHRTLLATVSWSYELLADTERRVFRRLGTFAGTFSLDAASAVAGDDLRDPSTLDAVVSLVERSLVEYDAATGRYRLLETLRQFAADRLGEAGEIETVRDRHADYFRGLADTAAPELRDARYFEAKRRLDPELDNVRAAATWLVACTRWRDLLTLTRDLYFYLNGQAPLDGMDWYRSALDHADDIGPQELVDALGELAMVAMTIGDEAILQECIMSGEVLVEAQGVLPSALGLAALGAFCVVTGDYQRALDASERARDAAALRHDSVAEVVANADAGAAFGAMGQDDESRRCGEEGLRLARQIGNPWAIDSAVVARAAGQILLATQHNLGAVSEAVALIEEHLDGGEVSGLSLSAWFSTVLGFGRLILGTRDPLGQTVASFRVADSSGIPYMIELALHELALACCQAGLLEAGARISRHVRSLGGPHTFEVAHAWLDREIQPLLEGLSQGERQSLDHAGSALSRRELLSLVGSLLSSRELSALHARDQ